MDRLDLTFDEFKQNLKSFLTQENAYNKYINNLVNYGKSIIDVYNKGRKFHEFIGRSFIWSNTEEGHEYWRSLNDKLQLYNTKKSNYYDCWND